MTKAELALLLAQVRSRAGMTQAELALAMGVSQPAIARAESGYRMPTLEFIDRWARATGSQLTLTLGGARPPIPSASKRRAIARSVLGNGRFNPWDREPSAVEAALLTKAGLGPKHFDQSRSSRGKKRKAQSPAR